VYPDNTKLKKQFEYADRKGIPYLAIVGDQEVSEGTVTLKNLASGEQRSVPKAELLSCLQQA
jgi:histidyl-tRNA synthetase